MFTMVKRSLHSFFVIFTLVTVITCLVTMPVAAEARSIKKTTAVSKADVQVMSDLERFKLGKKVRNLLLKQVKNKKNKLKLKDHIRNPKHPLISDDGDIVAFVGDVPEVKATNNQLAAYHTIELQFEGPYAHESGQQLPAGEINPAKDARMLALFVPLTEELEVNLNHQPHLVHGFFAADGNAAQTHAVDGNKWAVRFSPPEIEDDNGDGEVIWAYVISFVYGIDIAIPKLVNGVAQFAEGGIPHSINGNFGIMFVNGKASGPRGKGRPKQAGNYMVFDDGDKFIYAGPGSSEDFLAVCTDGAVNGKAPIQDMLPHVQDWNEGDPVITHNNTNPQCAHPDSGKGVFGAINYFANKGMDSVYFITMNIAGDGNNIFPFVNSQNLQKYDVSKLEQWEQIFEHLDNKGFHLQAMLQEAENSHLFELLDNSSSKFSPDRFLYYKEMIARFGHHTRKTYDLGEEIENDPDQIKGFSEIVRFLDPYDHQVKVHPRFISQTFDPLLGTGAIDGPDMQIAFTFNVYETLLEQINNSNQAGQPWSVTLDELGKPNSGGMKPDHIDSNNQFFRNGLYDGLLAGAGSYSAYFGNQNEAPNCYDQFCNNYRVFNAFWNQLGNYKMLINFLNVKDVPLHEMFPVLGQSFNNLVKKHNGIGRAKVKQCEAILLYFRTSSFYEVDLSNCAGVNFEVHVFDPLGGTPPKKISDVLGGSVHAFSLTNDISTHENVLLIQKKSW